MDGRILLGKVDCTEEGGLCRRYFPCQYLLIVTLVPCELNAKLACCNSFLYWFTMTYSSFSSIPLVYLILFILLEIEISASLPFILHE